MINSVKEEYELTTVYDLLKAQFDFQVKLGNDIPKYLVTNFEHVQQSIAQNVYQIIEFQEFMEAEFEEDRKEELIDYLLFTINKYIYLMDISINKNYYSKYSLEDLYTKKSEMSIVQCNNYANLEQTSYISLLRNHCIFKPWKLHGAGEDCTNVSEVVYALDRALFYFKQMAEIVYKDFDDFKVFLNYKLKKNIQRQNNGY